MSEYFKELMLYKNLLQYTIIKNIGSMQCMDLTDV